MRVDCSVNNNMIRTTLKPFRKPISFSNKVIKFLGLGALLLSGSALAEGLKARAIKAAPLALSCRDMCPLNPQTSSGNSTIPHMPGQNMSFIDTYLQPECEGGYQIFSQQMLRFLHAGYYSILVEPAFLSNNQWICQIQGEHHKPLNCVKNFNEIKYNIDHQTGRRPPRTERSPQIMNHYPQAEVSAFRLAVGYAQTHILQNPVFFDQPNETIIHHIKQLNGIMRQFEQPVLGKPYEFRNDRVIVSDQDKIIPDFHRLYPHATKAEIAEVTSLLDLAKSNRITEMLERIESSPKQLAVWHNLVGNIIIRLFVK